MLGIRIDQQDTHSLVAPDKADELAAMLTAEADDGWEYKAVHDPKSTGRSYVAVYDEQGIFLGKL